jgi:hypothetical protein
MTQLNKILLGVSMVLLLMLGIALGVIWSQSQQKAAEESARNGLVRAPVPAPVQPPPAVRPPLPPPPAPVSSPLPPPPVSSPPPSAETSSLAQTPPSPGKSALPPPFNVERPLPFSAQTPPLARTPRSPGGRPAMTGEKLARLQALQKELKNMTGSGQLPDLEAVDRLLGELIEIQGASVISGIDLNALRRNLKVAQNIQNLAKALEEEGRKPNPDGKKMSELRNSIYQEQQSLLSNAGGMIPPATAGAAAPGK